MATAKNKTSRALAGWIDRGMGRPLAIGVFAVSAIALAVLQFGASRSIDADAVGWAPSLEHAPVATGVIAQVHVRPGQLVREGEPLVTIEAEMLTRQRDLIDAEIRRAIREGHYEQVRAQSEQDDRRWDRASLVARTRQRSLGARYEELRRRGVLGEIETQASTVQQAAEARAVTAEEERAMQLLLVEERLRTTEAGELVRSELSLLRELRAQTENDDEHALERSVIDLWESELELLQLQRQQVDAQLSHLVVRSLAAGRVVEVLDRGAPVTPQTAVAVVVPVRATEVVAYLPAETNRAFLERGATALVSVHADELSCTGTLQVHTGAQVEQAPGQISSPIFSQPVFGLPLHVALPPNCPIGIGQRVSVSVAECTARPSC
jgi:multidrug resistance efflux pump